MQWPRALSSDFMGQFFIAVQVIDMTGAEPELIRQGKGDASMLLD
jgi:hypothetical protein